SDSGYNQGEPSSFNTGEHRKTAVGRSDAFTARFRNGRSCAGFWTPASLGAPLAPAAGVQKAPRHEVAGAHAPAQRAGAQRLRALAQQSRSAFDRNLAHSFRTRTERET